MAFHAQISPAWIHHSVSYSVLPQYEFSSTISMCRLAELLLQLCCLSNRRLRGGTHAWGSRPGDENLTILLLAVAWLTTSSFGWGLFLRLFQMVIIHTTTGCSPQTCKYAIMHTAVYIHSSAEKD